MSENKFWYDDRDLDREIFISSRVRLARNLKDFKFELTLDDHGKKNILEQVSSVLLKNSDGHFDFYDAKDFSNIDLLAQFETHNISQTFLRDNKPRGLLLSRDNSLSVMINEEDHIRIQAIAPKNNIAHAFDLCDALDDYLDQNLDYAFDKEFGYLTSCPTNLGTGMRASYMLHLPLLESSAQLKKLREIIYKLGITIRGSHGEGTESMGSIYQISNQVTLGKSEPEIIKNLFNITQQVIDQEQALRESALVKNKLELEDKIMRSFGILIHCKKISLRECMILLSDIKLGYALGFDVPVLKTNIYKLMIEIQAGCLQKKFGLKLNDTQQEIYRAKHIKSFV